MKKQDRCSTTDHDAWAVRRAPDKSIRTLCAFILVSAVLFSFSADAQVQTIPGEPANLNATTNSKTQISLSWTAPTNTGGTNVALTGYKIEYFAPDNLFPFDANRWAVLVENTGSTETIYNHDHILAPGTRLQYRVSAINAFGVGDPSTVAEAFTQPAPDTAGNGAPDPTAVTANHRRVEIMFDEELDANSVPNETQFQLTISGVPLVQRPEHVEVTGSAVMLTLSAEDAVDASDTVLVRYTPPREVIGDAEVPITRNALQDSEGNLVRRWNALTATNETPLRVALALTPARISENDGVSTVTATMVPPTSPAPAELTVMVTATAVSPAVAADFEQSGTILTIAAGNTTSTGTVTITAVDNDVIAADKMVTVSGTVSGSQDVSATASGATMTIQEDDVSPPPQATTTPPAAPRRLAATSDDAALVLTWQAPADNGGRAILRYEYRLQAGSSTFGEWTAIPDSAGGGTNAVSYRVTGLTNGRVYTVEVRAVNATGPGDAVRVTATPATPPAAPRRLAATSDDAALVLTWQAPADNGDAAILRYEYRLQAGSDTFGEWTAIPHSAVGGANAASYRVTGLTNGTVHTVEVRAVNLAGAGDAVRVTATPRSAAIGRFARLNREILALQSLSLIDQTGRALTQRLATLTSDQSETAQYQLGGQASLAQALHATLGSGSRSTPRVNLKELLGASSFVVPLRLQDSGLEMDRLTLWGQGSYTRLARAHDTPLAWDGDTLSAQVGADIRVRPDLLAGLAVTWADSGVDYQDRSGPRNVVGGTHDNWLVNVHPYVGWQSATGLGLWATIGYGWGELAIADERVGTQKSKLTVQTAAIGARGPLLHQTGPLGSGATTLTLKSDATLTRVGMVGNEADLAGQKVDAGRMRLLLEGQHTHVTPTGERLAPFMEVGVRYDLGEGLTGLGAELGGGLRYAVPRLGLMAEARGRSLVGHRGYMEWGMSGLVRVDPGVSGEGLAMHLAPTYGPAASQVRQLWAQAPGQAFGGATSGSQSSQTGLETEVRYGLVNFGGARVFTPYGVAILGHGGGAEYRLGWRWTGVTGLGLNLEGVRQEPTGQHPLNQGLRLQATWNLSG